ncbi:protein naked cuticle homolog 2-like isoform X2 [Amphibalanus amphitrite]|uniref:protein naked cuticle homolog 2-like isoform X2 n=1 Tax=Amphibalanus amphitrite TaxID=1232801 RepID=UPI001C92A026|nr:protein naked cuticle homolog 2-like isoform X2 [Amphibalanus amphitrite]
MACECESRPVRMATLLKRWKMRMLGKYKHLSGIASDSECRRSEVSLRSASSSRSGPVGGDARPSRSRPAAQPCQAGRGSCSSFPRTARRRRAPLVRAQDTEQQPGRPAAKNEFSFTLYDLDGQGCVTQDDIAGLVRTIYELVGSSMDVPAGGGKTINVRLTVTPEPPPPPPPPPAGTEAAVERRAPLALPTSRRAAQPTSPVMSEMTSQCRRRHLTFEPPAKRHLTELLRDSMEKNNVTYNNVASYTNVKRSHTCREHVRHGTCRPVETENHYCTVGELFCPNAAAAQTPRQQQRDDYELLTRCAEFALRAEQQARQRSRRAAGRPPGVGGGGGGTEPPLPPRDSRPVHQHHHRHEHVHQHYHHYPSNVLIL